MASSTEFRYTPEDCPKSGRIVVGHLDGIYHGAGLGFFTCKLCGAKLQRMPYPEEAMTHPVRRHDSTRGGRRQGR